MKLRLDYANIETVIDNERDVNVASFTVGREYVSIQVCQYEEGDPLLDLPYVEHNGQESGQYGGISAIELHPAAVIITFQGEQLFEGKYETIEIYLKRTLTRDNVDFLVNSLFMYDYIRYSTDFDAAYVVSRTATRDIL